MATNPTTELHLGTPRNRCGIPWAPPYDQHVKANVDLLLARSARGVAKYGTTLADNPAAMAERIQHLREELLDGANYAAWLLEHAAVVGQVCDPDVIQYVVAALRDGRERAIQDADYAAAAKLGEIEQMLVRLRAAVRLRGPGPVVGEDGTQ